MGQPSNDPNCRQAANNVLDQVYPHWAQLAANNDTSTEVPIANVSDAQFIQSDNPDFVVNQTGDCQASFLLTKAVSVMAQQISSP